MKKIMFNDATLLTRKVIARQKTKTRRVIPNSVLVNLGVNKHTFEQKKADLIKESPYNVGEVIAVAQCYQDIYNTLNTDILRLNVLMASAGWSNKMFVRAEEMPHTIRILDIRAEQLQDISEDDCLKEGIEVNPINTIKRLYGYEVVYNGPYMGSKYRWYGSIRDAFAGLIDRVSGKGTWESNPYVYVYEFELLA